MKNYISFFKIFFIFITTLVLTGCVHDDKYNDPDLTGYQCMDITPSATNTLVTYKTVKDLYRITNGSKTYVFPENSTDYIEGYVSSSDETGNIYKSIYIQNKLENPTEGFLLSVDAVSTYTRFPQGSKIYIKLKGLAVGTYGDLIQLGIKDVKITDPNDKTVARIPEKRIPASIFKSCAPAGKIIPKVLKISEFSANNDILGALIQVNDVEFTKNSLCSSFAPSGFSVDKPIGEGWNTSTNNYTATSVVRNSGFASFANQKVPAGNGTFIGVFSKFNSSFQLYLNKIGDLEGMKNFPRKDGLTKDPCSFDDTGLTYKTIAQIKQLASGPITQITGDFVIKAKVTANDETGNLFKYIYVEDATGGIRININKANLYQDERFKVGKEIYIKLKNIYVGPVNGEIQLGQPFVSGNQTIVGQLDENLLYKTFFDSSNPITPVIPTVKRIDQLTAEDVGRWIKIKDVQFIRSDLYNSYPANKTLEDCSGNKIILRTNNRADFAGNDIDLGKGDIDAVLNIFNGTYQLTIPHQYNADLDKPRCDGSIPPPYDFVFSEAFTNLNDWTIVNVSGDRTWGTTTFGNPGPSAIMDGNRMLNEDWLISKKISLVGYKDAFFTFQTDGNFNGLPLEVYVTDNYTTVSGTNWVRVNAVLDQDLQGYNGFVSSGKIELGSYIGKDIVVGFKYKSVNGASTTWELDNFRVRGLK